MNFSRNFISSSQDDKNETPCFRNRADYNFITLSSSKRTINPGIDTKNLNITAGTMDKFKRFVGSHSGEIIKGLSEVKRYLQNYGYISESAKNFTNSFDEMLVSAIKPYQQFYNLEQTGQLDGKTVGQMILPRCGNPDVRDNASFMKSANMGSRRLQSVSHYNIIQGNPRWEKLALTFAFLPENNLTNNYKKTIARAFTKWQAVTTLTFTQIDSYEEADIKIGFYSGEHGCGHAFDGVMGELAHAYAPPLGWFHFDKDENWEVQGGEPTNSKGTLTDLESVAIHEIGHLLGLDHSPDQKAIMFPTITNGEKRAELYKDDIEGIQALYGANPNFKINGSATSDDAQDLFGGNPVVAHCGGLTVLVAVALVDIVFLQLF